MVVTADIRTAAEAEAARRTIEPNVDDPLPIDHHTFGWRRGFAWGAVWAAERVTPTREQLIELLGKHQHDYCAECHMSYGCTCDWKHPAGSLDTDDDNPTKSISSHQADAILALMQKLAEGES